MTRSRSRLKPVLQLLAAACVLTGSHSAGAAEIAPYFHTWDGTLMDARQNTGLNSDILAFGITHGSCVLDVSVGNMAGDARNFAAAGGKLMISFGGSAGTYVETACSDDDAFNVMEKVMLDTGIRRFDFDIEGGHVQDTDGTARRSRVLARLQSKYPDLEVTISLPSWFNGFSQAGMDLLRTTINTGVRIDRVIVMAQSFGVGNIQSLSPATLSNAVITAFRAAANQIAPLFPNRNQSQLYAMMGVTSMIGTNDDGSTFTLADASTLTDFVKNNGIGLLSWWSFQRDRAQSYSGASDINTYSGVAQSAWQFFYTFKNADGAVSGSPAPAAAAGGSCNASPWVQGKAYQAGSVVSYGGKQYTAKMWTAAVPTPNGNGWSDWSSSSCSGSPAPAAAAPSGSCNIVGWVKGKPYPAGSIVSYGGQLYSAKMWNAGSIPTPNAYGWTDWNPYVCN
jgi:chitinase